MITTMHPEILLTIAIACLICLTTVSGFLISRTLSRIDKNQDNLFKRTESLEFNYAYLKGQHDARTACGGTA